MEIKKMPCDPRNYRSPRRGDIEYIVLHYDGNKGATDEDNGEYFANNDTGDTSAGYFVDENSVTQSVDDGDCAFHCGATTYKNLRCRNDNSIGIEMCSDIDAEGNYIITAATVENAIELTKLKMAEYGVGIDCILRHFDVTGKNCPAPWVENESLWLEFKARLIKGEENMIPAEAKETSIEIGGIKYPTYILNNTMYFQGGVPVRPVIEGVPRKFEWLEKEFRMILK